MSWRGLGEVTEGEGLEIPRVKVGEGIHTFCGQPTHVQSSPIYEAGYMHKDTHKFAPIHVPHMYDFSHSKNSPTSPPLKIIYR